MRAAHCTARPSAAPEPQSDPGDLPAREPAQPEPAQGRKRKEAAVQTHQPSPEPSRSGGQGHGGTRLHGTPPTHGHTRATPPKSRTRPTTTRARAHTQRTRPAIRHPCIWLLVVMPCVLTVAPLSCSHHPGSRSRRPGPYIGPPIGQYNDTIGPTYGTTLRTRLDQREELERTTQKKHIGPHTAASPSRTGPTC